MKLSPHRRRSLALFGAIFALLGAFFYAALRTGPLAAVPVVTAAVTEQSVQPTLFGIATVEARLRHKIGPTLPGRVLHLTVDVGDLVHAGQVLGEMDPVGFNHRVNAQEALLARAHSALAETEARIAEASARQDFAELQLRRQRALFATQTVSQEDLDTAEQASRIAAAAVASARAQQAVARDEIARVTADLAVLRQQQADLRFVAPVDGLVIARHVEAGTTVVAGQPVIELIDPQSLWMNVRFDQSLAAGLHPGLPAQIVLHSQTRRVLTGRVLRVEPVADTITEEVLAKVVFDAPPHPLPPLGELGEVTVTLPALPAAPVVSHAALRRHGGHLGVWQWEDGALAFIPVRTGGHDLDGQTVLLNGPTPGRLVVTYSQSPLDTRSRVQVVSTLVASRP
ncbi:efflux RND transporter periplasmic adaptor subunit [Actomonas aquatica]|uniref:Efflux RND transporter periplasmic adaptor subunit n=1 Tax=Actomonas aquatica TaxID=2866162 RepID=A0ABZ1C5D1_9BACT|nr:efflux RND transporter periplasmic adaptor subunit [Opitutus sp. WL0086]WRQ86557.1 efflux RND transporter periplasmic adaptor subunit [Opitutus sp. WL0086]